MLILSALPSRQDFHLLALLPLFHLHTYTYILSTMAESLLIMPISTQLKYNINTVSKYIVKRILIPMQDFTLDPQLIVIYPFDMNKPSMEVNELKGGIAGGSILTGVHHLGMQVKARLGIVTKDSSARNHCQPIYSCIILLHTKSNQPQFAMPEQCFGSCNCVGTCLVNLDSEAWA